MISVSNIFLKITDDPKHPLFNYRQCKTCRISSPLTAVFRPKLCRTTKCAKSFFQFFMSSFNKKYYLFAQKLFSFHYKLLVSIRFYQSWFWMPKYTKLNFFKYSGVGTSTSEFSAVEGSTAPQCIWVTQIWYILFLWSQTQCATERRNVIW